MMMRRRNDGPSSCAPGKCTSAAGSAFPRISGGVIFQAILFVSSTLNILFVISMSHLSFWNQLQPLTPDAPQEPTVVGSKNITISNATIIIGYTPYDKIFGHVHIAKTAGTEINGELAAHFERVCGHKGYSYDAYQFNKRLRARMPKNPIMHGGPDVFSDKNPKFNRGRVDPALMREIGFEDCDYVSLEEPWHSWPKITEGWPLELHVPCRKPLDHFMSQCNIVRHIVNCQTNSFWEEIESCLRFQNRFSKKLLEMPQVSMKCFNPIPVEPYLKYMSRYLQRKRVETEYMHRDTNKPRNKTNECIWTNRTAADRLLEILLQDDYYSFCHKCTGSKDDLLAERGVSPLQ